jgi:DNA repair protein RadC
MRERYLLDGAESMQTYELLEMLLYYIVPIKDVNPLAHALINRFGSADGVFCATEAELAEVEGVGDRVARFLLQNGRAAMAIASASLWEKEPTVYDSYASLGEFFVSYFSEHTEQATVAMLLNAGMQKISVETVAPLDYASAGVRADAVISRAMALGASVVVMAHNHPHGPAYPTHGDIITSQVMQKEFSDCGLLLLEHYVVCGREFVGFHHRFGVHEEMDEAVCRFLVSKEALAK